MTSFITTDSDSIQSRLLLSHADYVFRGLSLFSVYYNYGVFLLISFVYLESVYLKEGVMQYSITEVARRYCYRDENINVKTTDLIMTKDNTSIYFTIIHLHIITTRYITLLTTEIIMPFSTMAY